MTTDPNIPAAVRKWYSAIGKKGTQGRLANLTPEQRSAFARAGGIARQAKLKLEKEQRGGR